MVYEEQLKAGLHKDISILPIFVYWLRTVTSLIIMSFRHDPLDGGWIVQN